VGADGRPRQVLHEVRLQPEAEHRGAGDQPGRGKQQGDRGAEVRGTRAGGAARAGRSVSSQLPGRQQHAVLL